MTFQVKKTLEDQLVFNRVNFSDTEAVQNNARRGATADTEQYVVFLDKGDNIPDLQEIVGKLGLGYYFQFIFETLSYFRGRVSVIYS